MLFADALQVAHGSVKGRSGQEAADEKRQQLSASRWSIYRATK